MALAKFHCTHCDADFTAGDWNCKTGEVHTVAEKTYYINDAPVALEKPEATAAAMKSSTTTMCNVIPEQRVVKGNDVQVIPGAHVVFVRGTHTTTDPRIQNALNERPHVFQGTEGLAMWQKSYLTAAEKNEINNANQKKYIERLENDRNNLIEQLKEKAKPAGKAS